MLGSRFIERVDEAIGRIGTSPASFPIWPNTSAQIAIRKATVEQFPYLVAFEVHATHVLVLAIATRRRSLCWLARAMHRPG